MTLLPLLLACDSVSRLDDTLGLQSAARWEWHGRIVVEHDSTVTLVRLSIDTTRGGGDVGLARYDFNPAEGEGDVGELKEGRGGGHCRSIAPTGPGVCHGMSQAGWKGI